ncbi:ribonuclease H-like domain, reverse transcriptase, RNA-dependent DNA polymerase [Tanacetum coccineum]
MPRYKPRSEQITNKTDKEGQITLHYPMLSRSNYAAWAIKMKVFMQAQGVWEAVEPKKTGDAVDVKMDKMALAAIYQGIPEDILLSLAEKETTKETWTTLKTMYMGADRVKTARVQTLKAELEVLNKIEETYVVKKLLRAVPSKFLQIASIIEQFGDLDHMSVKEVNGPKETRNKVKMIQSLEIRILGEVHPTHVADEEAVEEVTGQETEVVVVEEVVTSSEMGIGSVKFGDGSKVHDVKGKLLMKVRRSPNRLYKIQLEEVKSRCLLGKSDEEVKLWHTRMGHVNYAALKLMSDKEMVQGLPNITIQNGLCEGCLEGKQARKSFPTHSNFMSTRRLELVHGDLYGLISPPTPAGNREFLSKEFSSYCEETGLKRHYTAPYSPQQNGIIERRNRTVMEMARSTMKGMKVPDCLWGRRSYAPLLLQTWFEDEETMAIGQVREVQGNFRTRISGSTDEHYETNSEDELVTSISSVGSAGSISSSTEGGAPKRYRTLTDLYDETNEVLLLNDGEEPTSYSMACKHEEWKKAMKTELDSIERNNTWTLVELPPGRKAIGLKWVYKVKKDPTGAVIKHKARLVAKGYVQKVRIDFDEVYAPVARIETVRILLALSSKNGWFIHHLDVKSAFLNGELEDEVYVVQPEGYEKKDQPGKVYKLSKALYGLRQAPRAWNSRLDRCLKQLGFKRCQQEYAVYTRNKAGKILIIGVYVDDLIVTGSCSGEIRYFKEQMNKEFEMSDMGLLSYYLGIEVWRIVMLVNIELTKDEAGEPVDPTKFRSIVGALSGEDIIIGYTDSDFERDVNDQRSTGVHGSYYSNLSSDLDQTFVKRDNGERDKATGAVHRQQISSRLGEESGFPWKDKEQRADILTKSMAKHQFEDMRSLLGVKELLNSGLRGKLLKY